jgi:hypothetical protein
MFFQGYMPVAGVLMPGTAPITPGGMNFARSGFLPLITDERKKTGGLQQYLMQGITIVNPLFFFVRRYSRENPL